VLVVDNGRLNGRVTIGLQIQKVSDHEKWGGRARIKLHTIRIAFIKELACTKYDKYKERRSYGTPFHTVTQRTKVSTVLLGFRINLLVDRSKRKHSVLEKTSQQVKQ
jgi:hypothetical protein